eukprot:1742024-Prymnesium_polylepis.2
MTWSRLVIARAFRPRWSACSLAAAASRSSVQLRLVGPTVDSSLGRCSARFCGTVVARACLPRCAACNLTMAASRAASSRVIGGAAGGARPSFERMKEAAWPTASDARGISGKKVCHACSTPSHSSSSTCGGTKGGGGGGGGWGGSRKPKRVE